MNFELGFYSQVCCRELCSGGPYQSSGCIGGRGGADGWLNWCTPRRTWRRPRMTHSKTSCHTEKQKPESIKLNNMCREQKQKRLSHEASPLLGPPSETNCLTTWGTLLWVYLFSNKDWNRICWCWCTIQPKLTLAATCVSVNAFAFFCEKHRF